MERKILSLGRQDFSGLREKNCVYVVQFSTTFDPQSWAYYLNTNLI
jgi:hypothetical protein